MAVTHGSGLIPFLPDSWDPYDSEHVWVCWADVLDGASIASSTWVVPANWTTSDEQVSQTVSDEDGVSRTGCNGVKLATTETRGVYAIANRVVLSDGRQYERSLKIKVAQQ